jgi:hypothetical protein
MAIATTDELDIGICAIHEEAEIFVEGKSSGCFECGHVYYDDQALVEEWNETFPGKPITDAEQATFCPLCLHDW